MLAFKPPRQQGDGQQAEYSAMTRIDTGSETETRQDMKDLTDINSILRRHGVNGLAAFQRFEPLVTDVDDKIDMQMAIDSARLAQQAYQDLDPIIKERYPSMAALFRAAERGELDLSTEPAKPPVNTPPEAPANGNSVP